MITREQALKEIYKHNKELAGILEAKGREQIHPIAQIINSIPEIEAKKRFLASLRQHFTDIGFDKRVSNSISRLMEASMAKQDPNVLLALIMAESRSPSRSELNPWEGVNRINRPGKGRRR